MTTQQHHGEKHQVLLVGGKKNQVFQVEASPKGKSIQEKPQLLEIPTSTSKLNPSNQT